MSADVCAAVNSNKRFGNVSQRTFADLQFNCGMARLACSRNGGSEPPIGTSNGTSADGCTILSCAGGPASTITFHSHLHMRHSMLCAAGCGGKSCGTTNAYGVTVVPLGMLKVNSMLVRPTVPHASFARLTEVYSHSSHSGGIDCVGACSAHTAAAPLRSAPQGNQGCDGRQRPADAACNGRQLARLIECCDRTAPVSPLCRQT